MMRKILGLAAVLLATSSGLRAQTLGSSARQLPPGSLKFTAAYVGWKGQDLTFKTTGGGTCAGTPPANAAFSCGATAEVPANADLGMVVLQATYQPWEILQYYAAVGAGEMSLEVSSVTVRNSLKGDRPGMYYALGARAVILPDTVVSPAVAVDGRIAWHRQHFNNLSPARTAAEAEIDQRLDVYQYQIAVQTSHKFDFEGKWSAEPYGGIKWLRSEAFLKDLKNGGRVGGAQDTFSPFVGLQVPVTEREALVVEASFVDGVQYSAGLQVRFGGSRKASER